MSIGERLRLASKAFFGQAAEVGASDQSTVSMLSGERRYAPIVGTKELLEGYSTMPWLRTAAGRVGDAIGATTWELYAGTKGNGGKPTAVTPQTGPVITSGDWKTRHKALILAKQQGKMRQIENHPILDFLDGGNEMMPGAQVLKLTQIHIDLAGEAYWLLERNRLRMPTAVYPLAPHWVQRLPTRKSPTYGVQVESRMLDVPITEIIRFTDLDPVNPFGRGSGLGRCLVDELQTDEYAAKLTKTRFLNSGRPDLIVSADGLKQSEVDRLEQGWIQRHRGFWSAFKPFFAARKLDVQLVSQNFKEMQMTELRQYERDTIMQVWGVPPEIVGILESSNRATITAADFIFSAWVVEPRLEFIRRVLQARLVPLYDPRLHLDFETPVDEDKDFKIQAMSHAPWAFTDDEWREVAGFDPLPNKAGQVRRVPLNLNAEAADENPMDAKEEAQAVPQLPPGQQSPRLPAPTAAGASNSSPAAQASVRIVRN